MATAFSRSTSPRGYSSTSSPKGPERHDHSSQGGVLAMKKTENAIPSHVVHALERVLEYLWNDEQEDFRNAPRRGQNEHVYRALTVLARWRTNPSGEPDYFGDCPKCKNGGNDGYLNIGRDHWMVCHLHWLKWCVGANLFGSWRHESEKDWEANHKRIACYKQIPIPMDPEDLS